MTNLKCMCGLMCSVLMLVAGCATPPKPTQPEGEKIVINPHADLDLLVKLRKEELKAQKNNNYEINLEEIEGELSK
ncbi:hypothetical protein [Succinivibrio sp.]|uniref:hypothetical protein n=1 Tax=Succinivibrio sp. TaxID=2053619 RepID=UPI00386B1150